MSAELVYKICSRAAWDEACASGAFEGSAIDRRDGFIHLSSALQVEETAAKHFRGERDLVLVALDQAVLGPALRFEASRDGALFPHYYGALPTAAARWVEPLPIDRTGAHVFPRRFQQERMR